MKIFQFDVLTPRLIGLQSVGDDSGDDCFGRHAAFEQEQFGRKLDKACLAGPNRILETTDDIHAELRVHAVKPPITPFKI
jgi:hypothetical protein